MIHSHKSAPKLVQYFCYSLRTVSYEEHSVFDRMPKKNVKKSESSKATILTENSAEKESIELDKHGNLVINVHCKPGSASNMIQGESQCSNQPRLDMKIHARAVEGQANTELVAYLSEVLDIRKSDFTITHGLKSREKTIHIPSATISLEEAKEKIRKEIDLSSGNS